MKSCIFIDIFNLNFTRMMLFFFDFIVFSSPCQRQCELLPSLGIRRPSSVVR